MTYYVLNYSDYPSRPVKLFCDHQSQEGQSFDKLRFIVRCDTHTAGNGCLSWMNGDEKALSKEQVLEITSGKDWTGEIE